MSTDNLYTQADFTNLTAKDINKIKEILNIEIDKDTDEYGFLYNNIEKIKGNLEANQIISAKILAGQPTIKWFKFNYDNFTSEELRERLESSDLGYNVNINNRLEIIDDISSISKDESIYTIKILISDGYKNISNGVKTKKEKVIRGIVVKLDIKNCWVEIRAGDEKSKRISKILKEKLKIEILDSIRILNNYNENINEFKENLIDGYYLKYKAIPTEDIELTEDDGIAMARIIEAIDDYISDKNTGNLIEKLDNLNYDTDGLSISAILLAGIDNVGMQMKNNSTRDVSEQSLYTVLKDKIIEDSSYIKFSNIVGGEKYTMRIGRKSNSITFKTSITENIIEYIREKIL